MKPALGFRSLAAYLPSLGVSIAYFGFLALFLGVAAPLTPAPVYQGDKCFRCYRTIIRTRMAGEIVDRGGLAYKFRASACMAQYMNEYPQPANSLAGVFVADYMSGLLVPVEHAWFVETVIDSWTGERDFAAVPHARFGRGLRTHGGRIGRALGWRDGRRRSSRTPGHQPRRLTRHGRDD